MPRVGVVEDNPVNPDLVTALLEEAGHEGYVTKPLSPPVFRELLQRLFRKPADAECPTR